MRYDVKVTVIKKSYHSDLITAYNLTSSAPCDKFALGDTFFITGKTPWDTPKGFCGWAWADLQKMVWGMARGGPDRFVSCCTDGLRPVTFLLERLEALDD